MFQRKSKYRIIFLHFFTNLLPFLIFLQTLVMTYGPRLDNSFIRLFITSQPTSHQIIIKNHGYKIIENPRM